MNNPIGRTAGPGQVISLTQRSARRREYEMRAGYCALGWLRWRPGRRSYARAEGREIGPIELASKGRRVVVARVASAETLATVDRERGGSIIHTIEGHALRWTGPHEGITGPYVSILHHGHVMHRMPGSAWPAADIPPVTDPNIAADPARRAQPVIVTQCD